MVPADSTIVHNDICNNRNEKEEKNEKKEMKIRVWERVERDAPQAHRATAFHFLISNRLGFLLEQEGPVLLEGSPAGTIVTSESRVAILQLFLASEQNFLPRTASFLCFLCFICRLDWAFHFLGLHDCPIILGLPISFYIFKLFFRAENFESQNIFWKNNF